MNIELAEAILGEIDPWDEDQAYVIGDYSGRGMYGETTAGVVVDSMADFWRALYLVGYHHGSDWEDDVRRFKWDSMGMGYVIY